MMNHERLRTPEGSSAGPPTWRSSPVVLIAGYGLACWFVPFAAAMAMYPLRMTNRALFESAMAIVLAGTVVATMTALLSRLSSEFMAYGIKCGAIWVLECLVLDAIAYSAGPMLVTPLDYIYDIGTMYFMIPLLTIGLAWQRQGAKL